MTTKTKIKVRLQFKLPIDSIKHTFPWLCSYAEQVLRSQYLETAIAPYDVWIPREFLYFDLCQDRVLFNHLPSDKIELLNRVIKAFRRNNYTYYEQYQFVWQKYLQRSLYGLPVEELKKILLELSFNG